MYVCMYEMEWKFFYFGGVWKLDKTLFRVIIKYKEIAKTYANYDRVSKSRSRL